MTLHTLARKEDNKVAIAQADAVAPFMALLSRSGADGIKEAAAQVLQILALDDDNNVAIVRAGAVVPLSVTTTGWPSSSVAPSPLSEVCDD